MMMNKQAFFGNNMNLDTPTGKINELFECPVCKMIKKDSLVILNCWHIICEDCA